jgi:hypothetical protein
MNRGLDRINWISVVVAALSICGLLAMHGFEAALVHADHAGPSGHVVGADLSTGEQHLQHGACSLEIPHPELGPLSVPCQPESVSDETTRAPDTARRLAWSPANRAVLTAHSILRL